MKMKVNISFCEHICKPETNKNYKKKDSKAYEVVSEEEEKKQDRKGKNA